MVQLCEAIGNSKVKLNSIPNISLPHVKLRFHGSIMKIASKSMPMFIGSPKKIRSSVAPGLLRERDRQQYVDPPPAKFSGLFIQLIAPCYPHKIKYIYILQEEQSLCFLEALQNIHLSQLRITCSSRFCVAGVGRSIITLLYF